MSDQNGNADPNVTGMSRILSLNASKAPKHALSRAQRAEAEKLAYDMVMQECAKVHEYYLNQIPAFVARMIQDALVSYGLIKLTGEALAATESVPGSGAPRSDPAAGADATGDSGPSDGPTVEPALAAAPPAERPAGTVAPVSGEPL